MLIFQMMVTTKRTDGTRHTTLLQPLCKAQTCHGEQGQPQHQQHQCVTPQNLYPDAFEEDAANDVQEITQGDKIRYSLDNSRHVFDGKHKTRQ
jgi:hypothetical protein